MGLIVYDMGRRIETPVTPPRLRTRRASPAQASREIGDEHGDALLAESYGAFSGSAGDQHAPQSVAFARDIMTPDLITALESDSPEQAFERMSERGVHHLPVINAEGALSAIISDRDLLRAFMKKSPLPETILPLASRPVYCVQESTDIRQTARLLCDYHIGALPVLNEHQLLTGIITRTDLLQLISHYGPLELWA